MGGGFRPKSLVAGFLSAANQKYLAEQENIHVCQGNIWSQFGIDNGDGDGSISYPYYPSTEHFCKPAQGREDFIDCVNLDGWTVDFISGVGSAWASTRWAGKRRVTNSRFGVGPIQTIGWYGPDRGCSRCWPARQHTVIARRRIAWLQFQLVVCMDYPGGATLRAASLVRWG